MHHNLDEADRLCDRIAIFKQKVIAVDTPAALRQQLFGRKIVVHLATLQPEWADMLRGLPFVQAVEALENKLIISLANPEQDNPEIVRQLVEAGAAIRFIGELRHSLEQVYLEMLHQNGQGRQA